MEGAVFPDWLRCAEQVMTAQSTSEGYRGANIFLDGKPPAIKVQC
jgi:hypothetical protein